MLALSLGASISAEAAAVKLTIDAASRFQVIDGFGAGSLGGFSAFERGYFDSVVPAGVSYRTDPTQRAQILETLVRELGVTQMRVWMFPSGIEESNDNDDPQVFEWNAFTWAGQSALPQSNNEIENRQNGIEEWGDFLKTVVSLGLRDYTVTPARMPAWLAQKFASNAPDRFDEYAEWAAAHLLYLKKNYGLETPYWSLFNEADNQHWIQPEFWTAWVRTTGARFKREGLATKLLIPDFMDAHRALDLAQVLLASDETRQFVGALGYHHYGTSGDGPRPFLDSALLPWGHPGLERLVGMPQALAELGRRYGLPSWQTEAAYYIQQYRDLTETEIARARANEFFLELSAGASSVQTMFAFWPDAVDPRYGASCRSEGHPIVLTTDGHRVKSWAVTKDCGAVMAHYGKYVRPGDQRILINSPDPGLRAIAFVSDQRKQCVAVLINNLPDSRAAECEISGLAWKIGSIGGIVTDQFHTFTPHKVRPPRGKSAVYRVVLPPLSICTLVWSEAPVPRLGFPAGVSKR